MIFVEKHPDPGPMPPDPGDAPDFKTEREKWNQWQQGANAYNMHLMKVRKHRLALSVDALSEKMSKQDGKLEPADSICQTLAIMFLEGTIRSRDPSNVLENLLGIL